MLFQVLLIKSSALEVGLVNGNTPISQSNISLLIDWFSFIPDLIATFLGFALALLGQWVWERHKDKSDAQLLKKLLASELARIKRELTVITGISVEPFKLPMWDTCISTGDLKLLDNELQAQISLVYSIIKEINSWSLIQANYYFENNKLNNALETELERLKIILLGDEEQSISNLLIMLERGK